MDYMHVVTTFVIKLKKTDSLREQITRCPNVIVFEFSDAKMYISKFQDQS